MQYLLKIDICYGKVIP